MTLPAWLWPWQEAPVPPYEPEGREMVATDDGREVILVRRPKNLEEAKG